MSLHEPKIDESTGDQGRDLFPGNHITENQGTGDDEANKSRGDNRFNEYFVEPTQSQCAINEQGKKILLTDYSGLQIEEIPDLMDKAVPYFESQPPKSVLTLVDLTGVYIVGNLFKKGKRGTKNCQSC